MKVSVGFIRALLGLTHREAKVLYLLYRLDGQVVSGDELVQMGGMVSAPNVRQHICAIRKKLGSTFIRSPVGGRGYFLPKASIEAALGSKRDKVTDAAPTKERPQWG